MKLPAALVKLTVVAIATTLAVAAPAQKHPPARAGADVIFGGPDGGTADDASATEERGHFAPSPLDGVDGLLHDAVRIFVDPASRDEERAEALESLREASGQRSVSIGGAGDDVDDDEGSLTVERSGYAADPDVARYGAAVQAYTSKLESSGAAKAQAWVAQELARLRRLLDATTVTEAQRRELSKRVNVLRAFSVDQGRRFHDLAAE